MAPALVDMQKEMVRLNIKLKESPNVHRLFSEVRSQEQLSGDIYVREYKLSELLSFIKAHTQANLDTPAHFFAQDFNSMVVELQKLVATSSQETLDNFGETAQMVFTKIASISNNGGNGGILYSAFIESKISSYLDEISNEILLGEDVTRARAFNKFNYLFDLFEYYQTKIGDPDSSGASNIPLMQDISKNFYNVFGNVIAKKIKSDMKKYQHDNSIKRELLHTCAIFFPHFGHDTKDYFKSSRKFCKNLLQAEGGLPLLRNDSEKYPLHPPHSAAFGRQCYYRDYERAVTNQKIIRHRQRINDM